MNKIQIIILGCGMLYLFLFYYVPDFLNHNKKIKDKEINKEKIL